MKEPVISVTDLTRRYADKPALASVNLSVPRGVVYGLVGANGAGKTTLIKHMLGLCEAQSGSVRVFGLDPVADPVGVLSRIGYLSEDPDLPGWMSVAELIGYSRAFYPAYRYFSAPNYARYPVRGDGCYYEQGYGGFDRGILLVCRRDR